QWKRPKITLSAAGKLETTQTKISAPKISIIRKTQSPIRSRAHSVMIASFTTRARNGPTRRDEVSRNSLAPVSHKRKSIPRAAGPKN
ncbi:MAG: hypothetical protein ACRETL_06120, partial [Gammaproteobacteria bacterium]